MPDGSVDTAFRGELRHGDHAEFALLERKHRETDLTESILFTTLEPCAPGSRRHPKLSCAERIVLARIKKVWVGLEDPDPAVARKGIKYLQDNDIEVRMFDRDLQQIIEEKNRDFLLQAKERAEDVQKIKPLALTNFEKSNKRANISDLSEEALTFYKDKINFKRKITSSSFINKLYHKGVLDKEKNKFIPTGIGLILFGKSPEDFYPQAIIKATIKYPNGKTDIEDFGGPLVFIPDAVENWWKRVIPSSVDRSSAQRKTIVDFPYEPVREAVTNALVHRDYDIKGATSHLMIDEHTVTVRSPGGPIAPITLEQLQNFDAPTLSRNPQIFSVLAELGMVERRGLGMETYKSLPNKYNLPFPLYSFMEPFLDLVFYRTSKDIPALTDKNIFNQLNNDEKRGVEYIFTMLQVSKKDYAQHFNFNSRKAERHLKHFTELGIVRRQGSGPSTIYVINRKFTR
jgi:ATP-dependent DNA helicase RecG